MLIMITAHRTVPDTGHSRLHGQSWPKQAHRSLVGIRTLETPVRFPDSRPTNSHKTLWWCRWCRYKEDLASARLLRPASCHLNIAQSVPPAQERWRIIEDLSPWGSRIGSLG